MGETAFRERPLSEMGNGDSILITKARKAPGDFPLEGCQALCLEAQDTPQLWLVSTRDGWMTVTPDVIEEHRELIGICIDDAEEAAQTDGYAAMGRLLSDALYDREARLEARAAALGKPPHPDAPDTALRMREAWRRWSELNPEAVTRYACMSPEGALRELLREASRLPDLRYFTDEAARHVLCAMVAAASSLLPGDRDPADLCVEEYARAAEKHPGMTLECDGHTDETRLFALVEEIGEVSACLTYDNAAATGHGSDLESEAVQVAALALTWATRYLSD